MGTVWEEKVASGFFADQQVAAMQPYPGISRLFKEMTLDSSNPQAAVAGAKFKTSMSGGFGVNDAFARPLDDALTADDRNNNGALRKQILKLSTEHPEQLAALDFSQPASMPKQVNAFYAQDYGGATPRVATVVASNKAPSGIAPSGTKPSGTAPLATKGKTPMVTQTPQTGAGTTTTPAAQTQIAGGAAAPRLTVDDQSSVATNNSAQPDQGSPSASSPVPGGDMMANAMNFLERAFEYMEGALKGSPALLALVSKGIGKLVDNFMGSGFMETVQNGIGTVVDTLQKVASGDQNAMGQAADTIKKLTSGELFASNTSAPAAAVAATTAPGTPATTASVTAPSAQAPAAATVASAKTPVLPTVQADVPKVSQVATLDPGPLPTARQNRASLKVESSAAFGAPTEALAVKPALVQPAALTTVAALQVPAAQPLVIPYAGQSQATAKTVVAPQTQVAAVNKFANVQPLRASGGLNV